MVYIGIFTTFCSAFLLAIHDNYSVPKHSTQGIPNKHLIPESSAYLSIA